LRNLLRHFFDGVQDFRRDSLANAEVFAFDPIDTQGARKQFKNAAEVDSLGDSEAMARKLRRSLRRSTHIAETKGFPPQALSGASSFCDMSRAGELESEYALW
jgi:hypothetical protein